uniref:Uncharacterized protein n=1 Tax=Arundo donax TaxID=35708 RepID=A0A0A9B4E2_ARUDO
MQMKTYRLDHGSLVWKLIILMKGTCAVELHQIVSGKGRLATSVLRLLIGAAVAYASLSRGSRMYMLVAVKEIQLFGVLLSSEYPSFAHKYVAYLKTGRC